MRTTFMNNNLKGIIIKNVISGILYASIMTGVFYYNVNKNVEINLIIFILCFVSFVIIGFLYDKFVNF